MASGADGFVNHLFSVDYQADSPSYYKTEVFFEYETDSFFEYKTSFFVDKTNSFFEYETGFFVDKTDSFFEYRIDGFVEHSVYCLLAWLVKTMSSSTAPTSGIPLHEYRRDVPPGWGPNIPDYPLKTFFERLKMWYRLYDGPDETVGPLVAGRLTGKAQKLALSLRLPRPDGQVDIGSDALVRLPVDEVRDPANPKRGPPAPHRERHPGLVRQVAGDLWSHRPGDGKQKSGVAVRAAKGKADPSGVCCGV